MTLVATLTKFTSPTSPFHDFQAVGGTSAGLRRLPGIMALVNQKTGQRQGNANITLYSLAKSETFSSCNSSDGGSSGSSANTTCVFNDITKGNISVPCSGASANCSKTSSGGFGVVASGGNPGVFDSYRIRPGDGPGIGQCREPWSANGRRQRWMATTITLSPSPSTIRHGGNCFTLSGKVTKTGSGATPTGAVVFRIPRELPSGFRDRWTANGNYSATTALLPAGTYTLRLTMAATIFLRRKIPLQSA